MKPAFLSNIDFNYKITLSVLYFLLLAFEIMNTAIEKLNEHEVAITGTGKPKIGAHGKPVVFLHPKDCNGSLIELEEV